MAKETRGTPKPGKKPTAKKPTAKKPTAKKTSAAKPAQAPAAGSTVELAKQLAAAVIREHGLPDEVAGKLREAGVSQEVLDRLGGDYQGGAPHQPGYGHRPGKPAKKP
jgi:hypothetical protein